MRFFLNFSKYYLLKILLLKALLVCFFFCTENNSQSSLEPMEPNSKDSIKERKNFTGETILFFDYTEKLFGEIPANNRINVILCEQFNDTLKIMLDTMLIAEGYFKTNESTSTVIYQDIMIPRDIAKNKKLLFLNNKNEILCVIQLRKIKNQYLYIWKLGKFWRYKSYEEPLLIE